MRCFIDPACLILVNPGSGSPCIGHAGQEHEDMVVALVCLWVGFAIGFVTAAVLRGGSRDEERLPVAAPARKAFKVSRVHPQGMKAGNKTASRNALEHIETVD